MRHARPTAVALIAAAFALAGCAGGARHEGGGSSTRAHPTPPAPAARPVRDYAMVFIKTGPLRSPTQAQRDEAMSGHMANMQRLAEDGTLLIAGPLAEPRSDPDHRGIFVFDADTADKGLALAGTDPAAQMGVFVMEPFVLSTDAPLTELPRLEREDERRRLSDPEIDDAWVGRLYVLASARYDQALAERVHDAPGVLIAGTLTNSRGQERVFLWLDAPNPQLAAGTLPEADWTYHGWYGSPTVARLPGLR
jgi:uncharacterized protein YciI